MQISEGNQSIPNRIAGLHYHHACLLICIPFALTNGTESNAGACRSVHSLYCAPFRLRHIPERGCSTVLASLTLPPTAHCPRP